MVKIIKEDLDIEEALKKKLEFICSFCNTNLGITEPYKIIIKNNKTTLIAYLYEDNDKIYLPTSNAIISFTKFTQIISKINGIK